LHERVRSRFVAVVIVLILALQVGIPLVAMTAPDKPARFGWHMYAYVRPAPEIALMDAQGRETRANPFSVIARYRPELPYERALPPYLCARHPGTVGVRLTRTRPPLALETPC
jgi:hypothetical protein